MRSRDKKAVTSAGSSSLSMVIQTKPFPAVSEYNFFRSGMSSVQGPHHVAQNSMKIGLPRNAVRFVNVPSVALSERLGAGLPMNFAAVASGSNWSSGNDVTRLACGGGEKINESSGS